MEIKKYIKEYKNFLSPIKISAIIRYFENKKFNESCIVNKNGTKIDKKIRDVVDYGLFINKSITETHWYNFLNTHIGEQCKIYKQELNLEHLTITSVLDLILLKYEKGGKYVPHTDDGPNTPRTLSAIIYLNNDYEGGCTKFFDPSGKEIHEVKPEVGKIVIFPSNFLFPHQATEVVKGTRYVFVSWIR